MPYELYYWPGIQGRGEFVRLALEAAGAEYIDVTRLSGRGKGVDAMLRLMDAAEREPFAPPFLKAGKLIIAQVANILQYLGPRIGLGPKSEAARLWTHQLQLTVTDFVHEIHDTHHPIASSLYYEEQKDEARARTGHFLTTRLPKYLGYFERVIENNGTGRGHTVGRSLSYVDLSMFQLISGLRYAFPKTMSRRKRNYPRLSALHEKVATNANVAAYLASERRIAFNEDGVFRCYTELER
ncbi:MAG: glutathione S-transferase [Betaproteobacteria bacterium]|nr:MAG: glutathione S-transferase [Betaproteobacteria bacterium]